MDWLSAGRRIFQNESRRPVLVVGTGLLKQLMAENLLSLEVASGVVDWAEMLEEVADHLHVPFSSAAALRYPTLYWDCLLADAASRSKEDRPWQLERRVLNYLKKRISKINQVRGAGCWASKVLSYDIRSIVSLNFCIFPFAEICDRVAVKAGRSGSVTYVEARGKKIWFPHGGSIPGAPMRLGVRAYAHALERLEGERRNARRLHKEGGGEPSFMTDVLESPLVFIGCGLQDAEWTIWWMLATKRRNQARVLGVPTGYFVTADEVSPEALTRFEMLGCKVLKARCHGEAWSKLGDLLTKPAERQKRTG